MRCDRYISGERCRSEATHYLVAGEDYCPDGPFCAACAQSISDEINAARIEGEDSWGAEEAVIVNGFPLRARDKEHRAAPCGCRFIFGPAGDWALQARCADKSHSEYSAQKRIVEAAFFPPVHSLFDMVEEEVA